MDRQNLNQALKLSAESMKKVLEDLRVLRAGVERGPGGRELSEAITNFETGCMWMIRAGFTNKDDYNPARVYEKGIEPEGEEEAKKE